MIRKTLKSLLTITTFTTICFSNWETIGGNSARTSFLDVIGPEAPTVLWEGSLPAGGGLPILISDNKLVTTRAVDWENAPIVCHDIFTGDTLWTLDFGGGSHSTSIPIGFRNNIVYAANWFGNTDGDTLYAINADNGEIIWKSTILIFGSYYLGIAFTENGDIIIPLRLYITRINHITGDTLWCTERHVPVMDSYCGLSVFKETAYGWELGPSNEIMIVAIDVETGKKKYRIEIPTTNSPLNYATGPLPVIDNDGIIYIHRANDNLVALEDNGDSLIILWNIPIRGGGYTKPAVGPYRSLYFTHRNKIMRANTETGDIIDSSIVVNADTSKPLNGHFSIDCTGTIYFNNNTYNQGNFYSFTQDLLLTWSDSIKGISYGGPALSRHGLLAVAGADNILKVYRPVNLKVKQLTLSESTTPITYICSPNYLTFKYYIQYNTNVKLVLYNLRGQTIYNKNNLPNKLGFNTIRIEDSNFYLSNGTYIYNLQIGNSTTTGTLHITK